jgi:hypothetical protein
MRLYHDRQSERTGGLDARDEEDCYTPKGRLIGVFVSTTPVEGDGAYVAEVDPDAVEAYEVTAEDASERDFVIPGAVVAGLGFARMVPSP